MKKLVIIIFVAVIVSFNFSLNAQNFGQSGSFELGGSVGFSSSTGVSNGKSADESLSSFSFQPYAGYFIIDNLELGLIPSFMSQSFGDFSQTAFGVYFAPAWHFNLKSNVYPFLEGRIGYNTTTAKNKVQDQTVEATWSGLAWGFRGGVKVQLGSSALMNFGLAYEQITMNPKDWNGDRNGNNSFGVNVGFTVFLPKK